MQRKTDPMTMTRRQWRPHFESRPYQMSPGRRQHIFGQIEPMDAVRPSFLRRLVALVSQ